MTFAPERSEQVGQPSRLIVFVIVFVDLLGFGIMIPMLPFFARSFGATAFEVGSLMFVYSFMQIVVSPLWGQLSDRFGRRPILLITILGQALAFLWAGMSGSFLSLLLSRVFAGIFAANISTASAYMADITPKADRAKGMGLIGAAFGLGFIFGPAVGGVLLPYGHYWPSLAAAAVCLMNFFLALALLKEPPVDREARSLNRRRVSLSVFQEALANPRLMRPMLSFFLITFAFVQLEITFGLFVVDRLHLPERDAGFLLAFLGVTMAVVQGMMVGPLTKRFSEASLVKTGALIAAVGLAMVASSSHIALLMAALVLVAGGYSLMNPCLSAMTSKSAPEDRQGAFLGMYQSMGAMARLGAPLLAGYLYDFKMELPLISALVLILIMRLLWVFWRPFSRDHHEGLAAPLK